MRNCKKINNPSALINGTVAFSLISLFPVQNPPPNSLVFVLIFLLLCVCVFCSLWFNYYFLFTPFIRFNYWAGIIPSKSSRVLFICEFFLMDWLIAGLILKERKLMTIRRTWRWTSKGGAASVKHFPRPKTTTFLIFPGSWISILLLLLLFLVLLTHLPTHRMLVF